MKITPFPRGSSLANDATVKRDRQSTNRKAVAHFAAGTFYRADVQKCV